MRVPGLRSRIFGRSFMLIEGSRNIVMTCAFERSVSKRSAFDERRLVGDTPAAVAFRLRQLDHVRVVFDAHRAGAALGRGDHGAAVTGAEIHHEVLRRDLGHVEHLLDEHLRRRHPDDVLAGLANLRLERLCGLRRLRERGRAANDTSNDNTIDRVRNVRSLRFSADDQCGNTRLVVGVGRSAMRYKWLSVRMKSDPPETAIDASIAPSSVLVADPAKLLARRDRRRAAMLPEKIDAAVGEDRRRRVGAAEPHLPVHGAGLGIEARRDAAVADDVELVADEQRRRRQRRAARAASTRRASWSRRRSRRRGRR